MRNCPSLPKIFRQHVIVLPTTNIIVPMAFTVPNRTAAPIGLLIILVHVFKTTGMNLVRAVISSVTTKTIRLNVNAATMRHVLRIAMPVTKQETSMGVVCLILRPLPGFLSRNFGSEYLQRRVIRTYLPWLSRRYVTERDHEETFVLPRAYDLKLRLITGKTVYAQLLCRLAEVGGLPSYR